MSLSQEFELFFELDGPNGRRGPVVSGSGLKLHMDATSQSVRSGTPGVVSDVYLAGRSADTALVTAELCATGLWARSPGGYVVLDDDFVDQVAGIQRMSDKREWRRHHRRLPHVKPLIERVLCSI
jgi:hypothetical protein